MGSGRRTPGRVAASLLCALALLAGLAPAALAASGGRGRAEGRQGFQQAEDFEDMGEARWAARYVVAGQVTGLIQGYKENGRAKFKPNQPLKRQEAVALIVRALGWEAGAPAAAPAQGDTVSGSVYDGGLPFRDADRIQPWARGSVALAVERGLVDAGEPMFRPLAPATRAWVVRLMVRALGLEAEARQRAGEALSFRDAPAIPADAVGEVAVAMDVGLVSGFAEDNTFRPQKPVTRAQMAKFLEVLTNELQQGTPQAPAEPLAPAPEGIVHGVVAAVEPDGLTLRGATGTAERRVPVAAGARVFVDDAQATLAAVQPGFRVKLYLDASGQAVLIDARSAPAQPRPQEDRHPLEQAVSGVVAAVEPQVQCVRAPCAGGSITLDDGAGNQRSFLVAEWAEVKVAGYGYATLADVSVGDRVKLKIRGGVAAEVRVVNEGGAGGLPQPGPAAPVGIVRGVVTALGPGAPLEVLLEDGRTATIQVDARTRVWIGKRAGRPADLRVGDRIAVQVVRGVAVRIRVEDRAGAGPAEERGGKGRSKDGGGSGD